MTGSRRKPNRRPRRSDQDAVPRHEFGATFTAAAAALSRIPPNLVVPNVQLRSVVFGAARSFAKYF
jgi:hypothetical protein